MSQPKCRFCDTLLVHTFVDLGMSPLSNAFLTQNELNCQEKYYPLQAYVCHNCWLVQLEAVESPEHIFSNYAYFSSYSDTCLNSAQAYTDLMIAQFGLHQQSQVIEIASNDGYLLQYFQQRQIPVLGIEPATNVARIAEQKGIATLNKFFNGQLAGELVNQGQQADLLIANNVLAQVPELNDFVAGMKRLLKPTGVLTLEFPHLWQLLKHNQFDTIYHEHFSYFSWLTIAKILAAHRLTVFDVEELSMHGGSLRVYVQHHEVNQHRVEERVTQLQRQEMAAGLNQLETYCGFHDRVKKIKYQLVNFITFLKNQGNRIVGYGAPAKGNTLLNYCGIRTDLIDYTVDRNPHKQGLYLPGTHIPIQPVEMIYQTRPNFLLILPWNLTEEIMQQMQVIRQWNGKFIIPIPQVTVRE